jgi:hypothetical protein
VCFGCCGSDCHNTDCVGYVMEVDYENGWNDADDAWREIIAELVRTLEDADVDDETVDIVNSLGIMGTEWDRKKIFPHIPEKVRGEK